MLKNNPKPFSKSLHDANDEIAKEKGISFLQNLSNKTVIENPDRYGIDLLMLGCKGSVIGSADVEIKHTWRGERFSFKTIHLPYRKKKFVKENSFFLIFNKDLSYVAILTDKDILNSDVKKLKNKYSKSGEELFFDIEFDKICVYKT